jgi:hypothetical protein
LLDKEREKEKEAARKKEQREKLRQHEVERRKVMEARVSDLTAKMLERLRPFVEAKHPGDKDDPETIAFQNKIKREAEDLKLESFGVEVIHPFMAVAIISHFVKASAYDWECVHDEGVVVFQVQEVPWDVRSGLFPILAINAS